MEDVLVVVCPIIGTFVICCIMGFVTKTLSKNKGYYGGFWWGFLLGIFGIIIIASKPVNQAPISKRDFNTYDIICKAEMKPKFSKIYKFILFLLIIIMIIPNIIMIIKYLIPFYDNFFQLFLNFLVILWDNVLFYPVIFCLCINFIVKFIVKRSSLNLNKDGISGNQKTIFSNKILKLPIESIDSISVKNGFKDKLFGSETVVISTSAGLIRFMCVQNASEFVEKTLEAIKTYKETDKSVNASTTTNTGIDNLEQIQKLKTMLDNGIITPDEFDAKKKQLLGL